MSPPSSFRKSCLREDQRPDSVERRELPVLSVRNSQVARERDKKAFIDTAMQDLALLLMPHYVVLSRGVGLNVLCELVLYFFIILIRMLDSFFLVFCRCYKLERFSYDLAKVM